ncbi:hypothetical protein niasHT_019939 [Heterodera trifolii]|uniref:Protein kinase domain-containing protein n=1 Tax=Heterodera trifolii TaxID=157864 RepID=A0ABD2L8L5_9BILA
MGNYKSRPQLSCADELKKRISEGYAIVRSKLNDDIKPKFDARSALHINCFQGTLEEFRSELDQLDKNCDDKVSNGGRELSLLHLICIGICEQQSEKIRLLLDRWDRLSGSGTTTTNVVSSNGGIEQLSNGTNIAISANGDGGVCVGGNAHDAAADAAQHQQRARALLQQRTRNGFTALHIAVYKGDKSALQTLLEEGADPNATPTASGVPPPLHLAAMSGNVDVLRVLVAHGANLQSQDFVRYTALHCATYFGHAQIVRELLEAGADPNACGGVHDRPIHIAAGKANPAMLKAFLEAGADPTLADDEGNTALHFAAKTGHCNSMGLLLDKAKDARQFALQTNLYGDTALHSACYCGRMDAVKQLLGAAGSEVLGMENLFSETPLMAACTAGRFELVCFLMRQPEVDPNYQAQDGHTALHSACFHGHIRVVQYLLDNGADQSLTARAVDSPLINQFGNNNSNTQNQQQHPFSSYNGISSLASRIAPFARAENSDKNLSVVDFPRYAKCLEDQQFQPQTPILWAYEKGHDQIVNMLKYYANRRPDSDACSEYSSGSSSYTPLPSPLGRLRSMTKEKAEILQLRGELRSAHHLSLLDVELKEPIVYRGVYRGKNVAVKRYKVVAFGAKTEVDMFCREVSIVSHLKHTNIVAFIGACMDDPSQFAIITEFASAGSLFSLLHVQKRVFEMALRLCIGVDIARGMKYLHELVERPVIHRDLNSHNILLHNNGRAVVADFGESRFAGSHDKRDDNMTKQPGNLRWMAPEVFTQSCRYDHKVDVFSYALVLWEIHAAELPFSQLKPAAAAAEMAYKRSRPQLPTETTAQFPQHIIQILSSAWHHVDSAESVTILREESEDNADTMEEADVIDDQQQHISRSGINTVSQLKDRWEQMSVAGAEPTGVQTQKCATIGPSLSTASTTTPSSASTLEKLKQRVDQNGYVSQSARAIAAAKGATQLRDSFVLARRAANVAQRQTALIRKASAAAAAVTENSAATTLINNAVVTNASTALAQQQHQAKTGGGTMPPVAVVTAVEQGTECTEKQTEDGNKEQLAPTQLLKEKNAFVSGAVAEAIAVACVPESSSSSSTTQKNGTTTTTVVIQPQNTDNISSSGNTVTVAALKKKKAVQLVTPTKGSSFSDELLTTTPAEAEMKK